VPYSLIIFDFDGTLADSFPWFLRNVNDVADRFGFRRIAHGDVESLRRLCCWRQAVGRISVTSSVFRHATAKA